MEPFYLSDSLSFSCTQCGACCICGDGYYVYLNMDEAVAIRDYLGLSHGWFRRRYLDYLDNGELVAASEIDGRCVFLGHDGQCRVYPVRPVQCRTYPFWPEIVSSRKTWSDESRRCEGIDRGEPVAMKRIKAAVYECEVYDGQD